MCIFYWHICTQVDKNDPNASKTLNQLEAVQKLCIDTGVLQNRYILFFDPGFCVSNPEDVSLRNWSQPPMTNHHNLSFWLGFWWYFVSLPLRKPYVNDKGQPINVFVSVTFFSLLHRYLIFFKKKTRHNLCSRLPENADYNGCDSTGHSLCISQSKLSDGVINVSRVWLYHHHSRCLGHDEQWFLGSFLFTPLNPMQDCFQNKENLNLVWYKTMDSILVTTFFV